MPLKYPPHVTFRIDGLPYVQSEQTPVVGDLVMDSKDNSYGYVDTIRGDRAAVKEKFVVEVGIPLDRLQRLVLAVGPNRGN